MKYCPSAMQGPPERPSCASRAATLGNTIRLKAGNAIDFQERRAAKLLSSHMHQFCAPGACLKFQASTPNAKQDSQAQTQGPTLAVAKKARKLFSILLFFFFSFIQK